MALAFKFLKTAGISTLLCYSSAVMAHNVWLEKVEPEKTEVATKMPHYIVKFGHESEPYPLAKLTAVTTYSANTDTFTEIKAQSQFIPNPKSPNKGEVVITPENASLVFVAFDNGVWSKLPSGKYVEKTKAEAPEAELSMNPQKISKAILVWNDDALKSHNQTYELVPQAKPEIGKPLNILVLKEGKPVQGIKVGLGEEQPFVLTDENGIAPFTPTAGLNKVWAEFEEKVENDPLITERAFSYLLTFDLPTEK